MAKSRSEPDMIRFASDGVVQEEILGLDVPKHSATRGSKTSRSFHSSDGTSIWPQITITKKSISVSHKTTGGGRVRNTTLKGPKGVYRFAKPGSYKVEPGTYNHYVNGSVFNRGSIESVIKYE